MKAATRGLFALNAQASPDQRQGAAARPASDDHAELGAQTWSLPRTPRRAETFPLVPESASAASLGDNWLCLRKRYNALASFQVLHLISLDKGGTMPTGRDELFRKKNTHVLALTLRGRQVFNYQVAIAMPGMEMRVGILCLHVSFIA